MTEATNIFQVTAHINIPIEIINKNNSQTIEFINDVKYQATVRNLYQLQIMIADRPSVIICSNWINNNSIDQSILKSNSTYYQFENLYKIWIAFLLIPGSCKIGEICYIPYTSDDIVRFRDKNGVKTFQPCLITCKEIENQDNNLVLNNLWQRVK